MSDNKLFSSSTEEAVLASILQRPNLIHSVNGLRHHMFSSLSYSNLFKEFEDLKDRSLLPDPVLVLGDLEAKNELDKVGGKSFIDLLLKREVNEDSFKALVEIVVTSYKARSFISVLSSVKKDDLNISNVDDLISRTRKGLDSLIQMRENKAVFSLDEIMNAGYDEIMARLSNPGVRGTTWGLSSVDTATGGKSGGDLWVISARPGMGKTALVCNSVLADGMAGVPSLLIEREMRKQELIERLISIHSGIHNDNIRLGVLNKEQIKKIKDSAEYLRTLPIYLDVNQMANDPMYFEGTVNRYHDKYGVQNVYLDYLQISTERDNEQVQAIGRLTRLSKLMANDLSICMILLSQLNRNLEAREDKRPLLSDMKMSGAIEEDADFVVGLYRDEQYNKETKAKGLMEYIILKHRNGATGTLTVEYDGPTYRISEIQKGKR